MQKRRCADRERSGPGQIYIPAMLEPYGAEFEAAFFPLADEQPNQPEAVRAAGGQSCRDLATTCAVSCQKHPYRHKNDRR